MMKRLLFTSAIALFSVITFAQNGNYNSQKRNQTTTTQQSGYQQNTNSQYAQNQQQHNNQTAVTTNLIKAVITAIHNLLNMVTAVTHKPNLTITKVENLPITKRHKGKGTEHPSKKNITAGMHRYIIKCSTGVIFTATNTTVMVITINTEIIATK